MVKNVIENNKMIVTLKKLILKTIIGIICLSMINVIAYSNNSYAVTGKVNESNIRVRKEPTTSSEIVKNLFLTDVVTILGENKEWYYLEYEGTKGYMKKEFIDLIGKKEDIPKLNNDESKTDEKKQDKTEEAKQENPKTEDKQENPKTDEKKQDKKIEEISKISEKIQITEDISGKTFPTMYSLEIVKLKKGKDYKVVGDINKWVKIEAENQEVWILKDFTKQV